METLLNLLVGVAIAVISSWVTVHLALNRFRTEKWWEKKAEAYSNLIAALYDSKTYSEKNHKLMGTSRDMSEEEEKEIHKISFNANSEIERTMEVGSFYLSQQAIDCLRVYKKKSYKSHEEHSADNNWLIYYMEDIEITNDCLKAMIEIARKDLRVK